MTTNTQIGLAYAIGKLANKKGEIIHLNEILGEAYKRYSMTINTQIRANHECVVIYKDLTKDEFWKIIELDTYFTLTQMIHTIEEVIKYDLKNET